jgi:hypothetical protein
MLIDINKLDKAYNISQSDLAYMTAKSIEQQVLLSEVEELLRIREDLQKVLP